MAQIKTNETLEKLFQSSRNGRTIEEQIELNGLFVKLYDSKEKKVVIFEFTEGAKINRAITTERISKAKRYLIANRKGLDRTKLKNIFSIRYARKDNKEYARIERVQK